MPPKKKKVTKKKNKSAPKPPLVIEPDSKLPAMPDFRNSAMAFAVANHDGKSIQRLVTHYDYGSALSSTDMNGSTLIHMAVRKKNIDLLRQILSYRQVDINAQEITAIGGHTALQLACINELPAFVLMLLQAGANADIKASSAMGESALHVCLKNGNRECARYLLQGGASPDVIDNFGNNPSFWAYQNRNYVMINELGLPPVRYPSAEEFLKMQIQRNPKFMLPPVKKKHTKGVTEKKKANKKP